MCIVMVGECVGLSTNGDWLGKVILFTVLYKAVEFQVLHAYEQVCACRCGLAVCATCCGKGRLYDMSMQV